MLKHHRPGELTQQQQTHMIQQQLTSDVNQQECSVRILLLGNSRVGKTRFLHEYIEDRNRESMGGARNNTLTNDDDDDSFGSDVSRDHYIPTSLEVYKAKFMVNNTQYLLVITDVTGNHEDKSYVFLRNSFYDFQSKVDVILLCFSMVDLISFADLKAKWMPEIKRNFKDVPIILVGTKDDLKQKIKSEKKALKSPKLSRRRVTLPTLALTKPLMIKQTSNASTTTTQTTESTASTIVSPGTPPIQQQQQQQLPATALPPILTPPTTLSSQLGAELILAGQSLLSSPSSSSPTAATTNSPAGFFNNPPPTPCSPPYRTARVSQSVSMISRMSKDELVLTLAASAAAATAAATATAVEPSTSVGNVPTDTDDCDNDSVFEEATRTKDATGSGIDTFRKLLEQLDKTPKLEATRRYYTVYEFLDLNQGQPDSTTSDQAQPNELNTAFLNETNESSNFNTTLGSSADQSGSTIGLPNTLTGGGDDESRPEVKPSSSSSSGKKYIYTRQLSKMKEEIGALDHFKTRADDVKTINALMERALAVGLNSHLRRRKAELKKQTSYEPKSIEDLTPFGDYSATVTRGLKTLEISAREMTTRPTVDHADAQVVGLASATAGSQQPQQQQQHERVVPEPVSATIVTCVSTATRVVAGNEEIRMIDESSGNGNGESGGGSGGNGGLEGASKSTQDKGCQTEPMDSNGVKLIKKKSFPLCCFDKTRSETMSSINKFLNKQPH